MAGPADSRRLMHERAYPENAPKPPHRRCFIARGVSRAARDVAVRTRAQGRNSRLALTRCPAGGGESHDGDLPLRRPGVDLGQDFHRKSERACRAHNVTTATDP